MFSVAGAVGPRVFAGIHRQFLVAHKEYKASVSLRDVGWLLENCYFLKMKNSEDSNLFLLDL